MRRKTIIFEMLAIFTALAMMLLPIPPAGPVRAAAATDNPSPASSGYETLVLHMSGAYTSTATPIKFKVPWPYRVLSISAYARTIDTSDTTETYTVDVKQGTTSLLSTPVSIAAQGTIYDGTLATSPAIPDETTVSIILTLAGTTPTITDSTVTIAVKRQ